MPQLYSRCVSAGFYTGRTVVVFNKIIVYEATQPTMEIMKETVVGCCYVTLRRQIVFEKWLKAATQPKCG